MAYLKQYDVIKNYIYKKKQDNSQSVDNGLGYQKQRNWVAVKKSAQRQTPSM